MRVQPPCLSCLQGLIDQAARIATPEASLQREAIDRASFILHRDFAPHSVAPRIATECSRTIREVTGNPDPYRELKAREMRMAAQLFWKVRRRFDDDLRSCVKVAAVGNTIDFFKELDTVAEEMLRPVEFASDGIAELDRRLDTATHVLYLADNAGECYFDLPLLAHLRQRAEVTYVVKGAPCQNDITMDELPQTGLMDQFEPVMTTGSGAVGIDLSSASAEFRERFDSADLILAKGMANYETLSELPPTGRVFHCLMGKCQPVAESLGVARGSYVVMLR